MKPALAAKLAAGCRHCPVCNQARRKQRGLAFWVVKNVERGLCPFGRGYTQVTGRQPHEPVPGGSHPS
jgi:hypothetical protein